MSEPDTKTIINQLADEVLAIERRLEVFSSEDPDDEDMAPHFADLHARITHAYENYQSGALPTQVDYTDDKGEPVEAGKGVPSGLPVDITEILFSTFALARFLGIDVGKMILEVGQAKKRFAKQIEEESRIAKIVSGTEAEKPEEAKEPSSQEAEDEDDDDDGLLDEDDEEKGS